MLPDCLGLCESQRVLPPHTFQCTSDDFRSASPVKCPSPALSGGNINCSDLPASWCFLTRLDEVLIVWFYGWKSLKSEFFVCFSIEMMMMAMGLTVSFALFLSLRPLGRAQL